MRYIAFLRAINVGGHVVKMAELKKIFESLGLESVETFIASGNVIFDAPRQNVATLEKKIAAGLEKKLGYGVGTFLRTEDEIAAVATHEPFSPQAMAGAAVVMVAFTSTLHGDEHRRKLDSFRSDVDDFAAHGREVYWLCRVKQSGSDFQSARFEKALGVSATWRNMNTVKRLAAKYPHQPRKAVR